MQFLRHYPNGSGRSENTEVFRAKIALPLYFVQTIADLRSGARKTADSRRLKREFYDSVREWNDRRRCEGCC